MQPEPTPPPPLYVPENENTTTSQYDTTGTTRTKDAAAVSQAKRNAAARAREAKARKRDEQMRRRGYIPISEAIPEDWEDMDTEQTYPDAYDHGGGEPACPVHHVRNIERGGGLLDPMRSFQNYQVPAGRTILAAARSDDRNDGGPTVRPWSYVEILGAIVVGVTSIATVGGMLGYKLYAAASREKQEATNDVSFVPTDSRYQSPRAAQHTTAPLVDRLFQGY